MVASAPIPDNEVGRLEALHSFAILDTPPEERFDLFTKMATWLFDTPVSAINFVDAERTFFKSTVGVNPYTPGRRTSICAHAVGNGDAMMIVQDLSRDSRFSDHPLTTKGLRFYAGALLRSESGHALGTLCVCDSRPHDFPIAKQQRLLQLAEGVEAVLDLHLKTLRLQKSAVTDPLTGLYNRRMLTDALQTAITGATPEEPCLLLSLDLDRFKHVNDQFGHAAGDALLCEVGRRLNKTVRAGDVVARLGGDEFVILATGALSHEWPERLAARILEAFSDPFFHDGHCLEISSSIGIARCPQDGWNPASLLHCADLALYSAKRHGRNQYRCHQKEDGACLAA